MRHKHLCRRTARSRRRALFGKEFACQPEHHRRQHELAYSGGGGHVTVRVMSRMPTTLEIETYDLDFAVRGFMEQLPR